MRYLVLFILAWAVGVAVIMAVVYGATGHL
jgi:hypothetical protein